MPDTRKHRGPHPEDRRLFTGAALADLRAAVGDLSLLLARRYAPAASLKLVGDRFALDRRQRVAVMRAACSDQALAGRAGRRLNPADLRGRPLRIDGYNLLTTVEAALAGGALLHCRDGTFRDMASMHGTYRKVRETVPAIEMIGRFVEPLAPSECLWYLDRPVSNSGRLKTAILEVAEARRWPWRVQLVASPDRLLARGDDPVATADSAVLDRCGPWVNLAREIVLARVPGAWIVDLSVL
jgi:hypothetical protein